MIDPRDYIWADETGKVHLMEDDLSVMDEIMWKRLLDKGNIGKGCKMVGVQTIPIPFDLGKYIVQEFNRPYDLQPYKMSTSEFNILASGMFDEAKDTLFGKGKEYDTEEWRLRSFHTAGNIANCSPEKALMGMLLKHTVSMGDIIDNLDEGVLPSEKLLREKVKDIINYHILVMGLINERRRRNEGKM